VKRYVEEAGSAEVDSYFEDAEKGGSSIVFSVWNIGELAVVFDKYERDGLLTANKVVRTFLAEMKRLGRSRAAEVVPVAGHIVADSVALVLKHHVYVADAIQIASCKTANAGSFVTADRHLAEVAKDEGLAASLIT
jgi:predicted nucleic acid-binding protein